VSGADAAGDRDDEPVRRVAWLSKSALRLHAALIVGLSGSSAATWVELRRGLQGRAVAWVYVFEWPLLALLGSYVWWRLLHDEDDAERAGRRTRAAGPTTEAAAQDDPELAAWQAYLARLHAADPPGRPPRSVNGDNPP
jgi:hypothetical protein